MLKIKLLIFSETVCQLQRCFINRSEMFWERNYIMYVITT